MAVIGKIREQSTLVLIIIGGAIMAFVLSDLFSSGGSVFNETRDLAEVNEHKISVQEFEVRVQNAYENYMMNSQNNEALDERTKSSIREQVWNDMLQDIILGEEMEELGLTVTTDELFDMVQGKNPHPQIKQAFTNPETGRFNSSDVVRFIQNIDQDPATKKQWIAFEKSLKKNQLRQKYATLVKKGLYFTTTEGQSSFNDVNTRLNLQYVMKPYSSISDEQVDVSEADIKEYYDEHKNNYEQDASIKVNYAYFPVDPSEVDQEFARKWAFDTYEKFLTVKDDSGFVNTNSDSPMDYRYYSLSNLPEGYNKSLDTAEVGTVLPPQLSGNVWRIQKLRNTKIAPDSVKARHILINTADRSVEEAKVIADSLKGLLANGANFEELAMANSDDVASAKQGGDVGWFTEGTMVRAFNDSAFSAEVGDIKIAESQYGYHIIEVTDRTEPKKKMQIALIDRTVEASRETYAEIFNKANSFSINAKDKESFDAGIKEGNIIRRQAIIGKYDNEISGLNNSRDLVRWIRDAEEGDISEAIDVEDAFVVVQVEEINEEGIAPLEKAKENIRMQVMIEKKGEILKKEMSGANNLEQLASKLNLKIQSANGVNINNPEMGNGFEGKVVGKAATLEQGQMSVPISGQSGVYVVKVDRIDKPQDVNVETGKRILAQSYMMRIDNNAIFNSLKNEADIVDNRSKFY